MTDILTRLKNLQETAEDRHQKELYDSTVIEIDRLRAQIEDAEIALNVWDIAHDSDYWMRYPRDPGDHLSAAHGQGREDEK